MTRTTSADDSAWLPCDSCGNVHSPFASCPEGKSLTEEAQTALAATSDEELLTKHAHLTHRIHETARGADDADLLELRAMRDLVTAECLRRMGGHQ